jgi:flagellar biosynthesis/type III secretory pathway protein FliH
LNVVPAASFLLDFSIGEPMPTMADEPLSVPFAAAQPTTQDDDAEKEQLEAAYARGLEEGKAAAEAEAEMRLEEQKASFEQSLAATRELWCREESARLTEQITTAVDELKERIAHSAEHALRPFLAEEVRGRAVSSLHATLQEIVANSPEITLEISGPEDLLEAVRTGLSTSVATVSYVAKQSCDVQVKAGASIIETRIAAWLEQISGPSQ